MIPHEPILSNYSDYEVFDEGYQNWFLLTVSSLSFTPPHPLLFHEEARFPQNSETFPSCEYDTQRDPSQFFIDP